MPAVKQKMQEKFQGISSHFLCMMNVAAIKSYNDEHTGIENSNTETESNVYSGNSKTMSELR
jgi:hypothetical protein